MPVKLSYSTIKAVIDCPHTWLCKQAGLPQVESEAMKEGKDGHRVIQDHISGRDIKPLLKELNLPELPIVEEKDFDPRLKMEMDFNEKYRIRGYGDGRKKDW